MLESMENHRLPADIEIEILLRLPVRLLKRFQCVSKSWYSLISSSDFRKAHFRRAQKNPLLLLTIRHEKPDSTFDIRHATFNKTAHRLTSLGVPDYYRYLGFDPFTIRLSTYNKGKTVKKFSTTLPHPFSSTNILTKPLMESCLGLVILSSWAVSPILVCNPSTMELITLPHNLEMNLCVGFGYTPSTQQFKVVRVFFRDGPGDVNRCEIFTLGTGQWREGKTPPFDVYRGNAPFLHGAIHFLPRLSYHHVQPSDYIAAFNIETEEYNTGIPLPEYYYKLGGHPDIGHPSNFIRLTKIGGSLCLTFDFGEKAGRLEMWILKDYHNVEWARGHTIDIFNVCRYPSYGLWAYPVEGMDDGSILVNAFDKEGDKLLQYDTQDRVVRLKIDKETAATFYQESLYPLHG